MKNPWDCLARRLEVRVQLGPKSFERFRIIEQDVRYVPQTRQTLLDLTLEQGTLIQVFAGLREAAG